MSTISSGLIEARMDQKAKTVTVFRAAQRNFGSAAQWTVLKEKLDKWAGNVSEMLRVIEPPARH